MTGEARKFSERETGVILRLASEIDARDALPSGNSRLEGRTIEEIEAIAAGAGIRAAAVHSAVAALESNEAGLLARVVGGPTLFRVERMVQKEIAATDLRDLAGSVRWALGVEAGEVVETDETVTWQHKTSEGPLTKIDLQRREGQTRMRLLAKYEDPAAWTLLGGGAATAVVSGLAIAALEPSLPGIAGIILGTATFSLLGARVFWRRFSQRVNRRLNGLMDRLDEQAAALPEAQRTSDPAAAQPDS